MEKIIFLRLLYTYLRHRWLYLLPIAFLTIAACIYLVTVKRYYISSGVIYTEQTTMLAALTSVQSEGFSWNTPAQGLSNQFSDLMQTDSFLRAVIQETDLEAEMSKGEPAVRKTISEARKRIWVKVAGSNQVQINASNTDSRVAYQIAQAAINTFVQWKINLDRIDSETASNFLEVLLKQYRSDLLNAQQALKTYLETHPQPARGDRPDLELLDIKNLQAEIDFTAVRLSETMTKAEDARLARSQAESNIRQRYTIVDAPDLPEKPAPSRRQLAMNAGIFVAAGVILSVLAVIGATLLARNFRIPEDVQQALELPVLAVVPDVAVPVKKKRFWGRKRESLSPEELNGSSHGESNRAPYEVNLRDLKVDIKDQPVEDYSKGKM